MSALTSTECRVRFWPHLRLVPGAEVDVVTEAGDSRGMVEVCRGGHTGQHWPPPSTEAAGPGPGQWRMRHPPNLRPILLLQIQPDSSLCIMCAGVLLHNTPLTSHCVMLSGHKRPLCVISASYHASHSAVSNIMWRAVSLNCKG